MGGGRMGGTSGRGGGGRCFLEHEGGVWMIMIPFVASWGGGDMRNYVW